MTLIEAAKQAREAMKYATAPNEVFDFLKADEMLEQAIIALNQAIAAAEKQEPEAWIVEFDDGHVETTTRPVSDWKREMWGSAGKRFTVKPLYTTPPKREWQGLTDEEAVQIIESFYGDEVDMLRSLEAKLKEKNT